MKTNLFLLVVGLCLLAVVSMGWAQDAESVGSPYDSLYRAEGLHSTHLSLCVDKTLREVSNAGIVMPLEAQHYYGQIGIDPHPWLTVSAGLGSSLLSPVPAGSDEEPSMMWMVGAEVRLLQFDITEPSFLTARCRVDVSASHWDNSSEVFDQEVTWTETRAALIGRAEFFVQELGADFSVYPYSIVYSIGAVYSDVDGDVNAPPGVGPWLEFPVIEFEDVEHVGILAGIELKIAYNLALEWEARMFNEVSHTVGLRYSF